MAIKSLLDIVSNYFDFYIDGSDDDVFEFVENYVNMNEDYDQSILSSISYESVVETLNELLNTNKILKDSIKNKYIKNKNSFIYKKDIQTLKSRMKWSTRISGSYNIQSRDDIDFKEIISIITQKPLNYGIIKPYYYEGSESLTINWYINNETIFSYWGKNSFWIICYSDNENNSEIISYSTHSIKIEDDVLKIPTLVSAYFLYSYIKNILLQIYIDISFEFDEIISRPTKVS